MLVGLVKKNGIMMIDFAIEAQRKDGKSPAEAMYEACLVRFRPIMMTTMAALVGTLPIALGWAPAPKPAVRSAWRSSAACVVSQTLTLFITPVFYLYMEALSERLRGRRAPIAVTFDRGGDAAGERQTSVVELAELDVRESDESANAFLSRPTAVPEVSCYASRQTRAAAAPLRARRLGEPRAAGASASFSTSSISST